MKVWRISNYADLSGIGGKYAEGRWNHLGTEITYCSDHPSTCLLELLVRFDHDLTPENYQLLEIDIPDDVIIVKPELKKDWRKDIQYTRDLWKRFCKTNDASVMRVPSTIMPQAFHFLLNPRHKYHSTIRVSATYHNLLDNRFYT